MPKFEFKADEVIVLKNMIDVALKATGIQAANAAIILTGKLDNPLPEVKDETKEEEQKRDTDKE